jgi:hypothetical protein
MASDRLTAAGGRGQVSSMKRFLPVFLLLLLVGGVAAWYWQSQLIGTAGRWYLGRIAASENQNGSVTKRREILAQMNRYMLMPAPDDALVPELFDLVTQLSSRVATGEISLNWAAYIYTAYQRDMIQQRPDGQPRRSPEEVGVQLAQYIQFFSIQKRPDQKGVTINDLMGTGDDVITLDEIQEAEKKGKSIDLRTRGAK